MKVALGILIPWFKCKLFTNKFRELSSQINKNFIRSRSIVCHSVFAFQFTFKCIETTISYLERIFGVAKQYSNRIAIEFVWNLSNQGTRQSWGKVPFSLEQNTRRHRYRIVWFLHVLGSFVTSFWCGVANDFVRCIFHIRWSIQSK